MASGYVVVDGSNIATEGRSIPSLAQLDEAVRAFMEERPTDQVIVVVDASFGYRIDESERAEYEQAEVAGEIVSPPAGAVGRGDGFLLRIADRVDAAVLSNDSFQEFHGEYGWLFDSGRLIGGKPVPGVGWIFTLRTPVRGPRSREATRAADKAKKAEVKRAKVAEGPVAKAIAEATAEVIDPEEEADPTKAAARRVRRRRAKPAGSVNDPLPFIEFIAEHPLGTEVEGEVDEFTSHGAFVKAGGARCYVPMVALGDPPPRSAKEVLAKGEVRTFVVQALDPPRRGIELALPGAVRVAGTPTEETVEADMGVGRRKRASRPAAPEPEPEPAMAGEEVPAARQPEPDDFVGVTTVDPTGPPPPARRSRKRAAAAALPAAGPEVVEDREAAPVGPPAILPPARRSRGSRKKAAQPVAAEPVPAEPELSEPAQAPDPAPAQAPDPAPARKTTRRRAPAAAPVPPSEGPEWAQPAVTETVPTKRATRKRAAAPASAPGKAEPQLPEPVAGPRRSPARAAARMAAPRMPVSETESEQPPPPRRTRARKAASSAPAAKAAEPTESAEPPGPAKKSTRKRAASARKSAG